MARPSPYPQPGVTPAVLPLGAVCALIAAWILPGLLGHDPWKPDEAYTFGVVYDFLRDGHWVVPTLAQEPFLDRPPFYYLTAAGLATLLSPPLALHDAARLVTGLYMAAALLFTALTARELYGRGYGRIASLTLISCLGFVLRSHQLVAEIGMLTGCAAAVYGCALLLRRPVAGGAWLGTGIGLAFICKGLVALGVFALLLPALACFPAWRTRAYAAALAVAAVAALPWLAAWPLLLWQQSPELFHTWLWDENITPFMGDAGSLSSHGYYLGILPWYALPALPLAAWVAWRGRHALTQPRHALPLAVFGALLIVLSASVEVRELYALTLLLPLALLATPATDTLRRGAANLIYWFSIMGGGFFVLAAWLYWTALELGWPPRLQAHLLALQPNYEPGFKLLALALGLLYTTAWAVILVRLERSPRRPIVAWAASTTVIWGLTALLFAGYFDAGKSYRSMATELARALPEHHGCIASQGLGESQRAMLEYYADIVTEREELSQRECNWLLVQGTVASKDLPEGRWRKTAWESARPGDKVERYRLYRRVGAR